MSVSPPPGVSAVQQRADRDRFRVEPGRIENYTIGKGSLAQQESYKATPSDGKNLQRAIKDGYESDSTLSYRRHNYVPLQNSSSESKNLYTQVQRGGEVPKQGLRMTTPPCPTGDITTSHSRTR